MTTDAPVLALEAPPRAVRPALVALTGACLLWGGSFLMGKVALAELSPAHLVFWRFLLGSLCLLPVALKRGPRLARKDLPLFLLAALCAVPLLFLLQVEGLKYTTATQAALLVGMIPPLTALGAALVLREKLGGRGWGAVGLSSLGLVLLVGRPEAGTTVYGDLLVFLSVVVSVGYILVAKRLLARYDALGIAATLILAGTVMLVPFVLVLDGPPVLPTQAGTWLALVGLGVGCTAGAYVLWNWGLQRVPASRAGLFVNLEPVAGTLLGVLLLGDPFGPVVATGGLLILLASFLA